LFCWASIICREGGCQQEIFSQHLVRGSIHRETKTPKIKRPRNMQGCQMAFLQTKKFLFGYIWDRLGMENVGIFYDHLDYITVPYCM
jgi:hypothetical protein